MNSTGPDLVAQAAEAITSADKRQRASLRRDNRPPQEKRIEPDHIKKHDYGNNERYTEDIPEGI